MYVQAVESDVQVETMERTTAPVLIIGHDLLALGLAALLRARGQRVIVRGGRREELVTLLIPRHPAAIIVDLLVAQRDDFSLLRRLRAVRELAAVPLLVLSPGTIERDAPGLESQLRGFGAQPMLSPHDLDAVLGALASPQRSVA